MADDGGVLGNLPRSRPGHRSEKRTGETAVKAAAPKRAARPSQPRKSGGAGRSEPPPPPPASQAGDPVGDAIRTVTGVAATGARVAGGVAREVLRRLPRP
jgi:hypothetical protein